MASFHEELAYFRDDGAKLAWVLWKLNTLEAKLKDIVVAFVEPHHEAWHLLANGALSRDGLNAGAKSRLVIEIAEKVGATLDKRRLHKLLMYRNAIAHGFGFFSVDLPYTVNPQTGQLILGEPRNLGFTVTVGTAGTKGKTLPFGEAVEKFRQLDEIVRPQLAALEDQVRSPKVRSYNAENAVLLQAVAFRRDDDRICVQGLEFGITSEAERLDSAWWEFRCAAGDAYKEGRLLDYPRAHDGLWSLDRVETDYADVTVWPDERYLAIKLYRARDL